MLALTPDRDLPESASYHKAVAALERGGVLEPVSVPGASGNTGCCASQLASAHKVGNAARKVTLRQIYDL